MKPKVRTDAEVFAQSGGKDAAAQSKHEGGGKLPALMGLQLSPLPLWDDRMSSRASPKHRKDAVPTKFAPCHPKPRGGAASLQGGKGGLSKHFVKIKTSPTLQGEKY